MDMGKLQNEMAVWAERQPEILALYLFGSQAEGRANALSDIDAAVLLSHTLEKAALWKMEDNWAAMWGDKLDLRVFNLAPIEIRFDIITRGIRIWERKTEAFAEIESLTRRKYWDLKPLFDMNWANLKAQVMENRSVPERAEYQKTLGKIRAVHQRVKETAKNTAR